MNESSLNQERKGSIFKSKLFGLPRPLAGSFIGILSFLLYTVFSRNTSIATILLSPGYWATTVIMKITNLLDPPEVIYEIAVYSVSSIPCAIIGSLIIASKQSTRTIGFVLLAAYLALILGVGILYFMMLTT